MLHLVYIMYNMEQCNLKIKMNKDDVNSNLL